LPAGASSLARARGDGKGHKHLAYLQRPIGVTASSSNSPKNGDFAARRGRSRASPQTPSLDGFSARL